MWNTHQTEEFSANPPPPAKPSTPTSSLSFTKIKFFITWAVAGMGAVITALLLAGAHSSLSHPAVAVTPAAAEGGGGPEARVTAEQLLAQWPAFRGWGGGAARVINPEVRDWDGPSGQNILWRTPIALPGNSSPVIWNNTIIVTGADESERQVMAFDLTTGKPLWQTAIASDGAAPRVFEETGYAAPTPVTDGHRAYAIFATGDVAALDLASGRKVWQKNLGRPVSAYGYAASLTIFADAAASRVIVQWDVGHADDMKSSLIALDGKTGNTLWQTKRPVGNSWASPLVTKVEGDPIAWQVVTSADPWVIGYDAATGAELWRTRALGRDVAPSPVAWMRHGKSYAFASQEGIQRVAIPISNARGDTTPAWKFDDEGLPDIVSPISDGRYVWTVTALGTIYSFDVETGKKVWEHEYPASFHATPLVIGEGEARELWLTEANGITHRLAAGSTFKEIGTATLGEPVNATFAFGSVHGATRIVIRGQKNLYGIGAAPVPARGGTQ
jgi:outer membrane protein assembly factor BamB